MGADVLRMLARAVVQLVDESRIHFDENGFWIRAVDPANVAMVEVEVEGWSIDYEPARRVAGVSWVSLLEACKLFRGDVRVVVDRELRLVAEDDEDEGEGNRTVSLPLINPSEIRKEPKEYSLTTTASVTVSRFKDLVEAHSRFGEAMLIEVSDGVARFVTEGDDGRIEDTFSGEGKGKAMYSLEYLRAIAKGLNGFEVRIELADDHPAIFQGENEGIRIKYVLAPVLK